MYANPKETTSLRLDATMKRRGRKLLALHGMTLTEAFEEYMDELVYRGGPPMRASREAKANTMRIRCVLSTVSERNVHRFLRSPRI